MPAEAPRAATPVTTQEEKTLRSLVAYQDRLYRVAAPLLIQNASLCKGGARNLLGFTAKTRYSYSNDYVQASQTVLGLDDRLQVTGVLDGSGAARAGIRRGDILLAVEGNPMPQGPEAERRAAALLGPLVASKSALQLKVARDGRELPVSVPLTPACAYGIELGNIDIVNSYADGRRILLTRGMLEFAQNDQELAYAIAREMAHNALGHAPRQKQVQAIASRIDDLLLLNPTNQALPGAAVKPYPASLDTAADKAALYMLARAGYPLDGYLGFWQRLANSHPASSPGSHTALHPSSGSRWPVIQRTILQIKAKRAGGKPLVP